VVPDCPKLLEDFLLDFIVALGSLDLCVLGEEEFQWLLGLAGEEACAIE
jgi:hypothetical protein